MRSVKWGVISTARIGINRVIPALLKSEHCELLGLASRDIETARHATTKLGIPRCYGSYEALLNDPDVEAVYIPLPNHLHLEWTTKAAEAGKHVLCEKPLALSAADAAELIKVRERTGVRIQEAFMVRHHLQWLRVREYFRQGRFGKLRLFQMGLTYRNMDPYENRNIEKAGGGALNDLACYPIALARFLYEAEPKRAVALVERDPEFNTDCLSSAILEFAEGRAVFTASTQLDRYQVTQAIGTRGWIDVDIAIVPPQSQTTRIWTFSGPDTGRSRGREEVIPACDQYALLCEDFSRAVRGLKDLEFSLEDSEANVAVLDALRRSEVSACWEDV